MWEITAQKKFQAKKVSRRTIGRVRLPLLTITHPLDLASPAEGEGPSSSGAATGEQGLAYGADRAGSERVSNLGPGAGPVGADSHFENSWTNLSGFRLGNRTAKRYALISTGDRVRI